MFDLSHMWYCHRCKHKNINKKSPIECSRCHIYKPLELYPSVFKNKTEITEEEYDHLEQRRQTERLRINEHEDYRNIETNYWYAIDSKWIYDWKMFVQNKRNSCVSSFKKSEIEGIGILDPGPITNSALVDEFGNLKEGLQIEKDYRMINERVWKILFDIYGGSPIIKRTDCDIYSDSIQVDEEVKILDAKIK